MGLNPKGRNWGSLVNWDDLGKAYAGFTIAWTVILYGGVAWLMFHRQLPFIRIRNLPLAVAAVSFLHVYLVKILLAYITNGHFTCSAEFWIMSIYLPFGIALIQANLVQLRSISDQQQKLVQTRHPDPGGEAPSFTTRARGLWSQWRALSEAKKTYILIGIGMLVQLIITGALYATTPTLQGDWSSYGHISHAKGQAKCRKSLQWIPSAFWQLIWAWFYGPYVLYKIRNIHDVHYWRLQTILSVVSGLPGSPLWLASLYSPAFKPVNKWWVPPLWLAPGIIVMQFVTIFFPIYEAYASRSQMRTTLSIIRNWEDKKGSSNSEHHLISSNTSLTSYQKSTTTTSTAASRRSREMHSMSSLDKALKVNPTPLLHFAATKDFTAENILFLIQVRRWRQAWALAPHSLSDPKQITDEARSHLFNIAVEIYITNIDPKTTEFPINIESSIRQRLDDIFGPAVPEGKYFHHDNTLDPFNALPTTRHSIESPHNSWDSHGKTSAAASAATVIAANQTPKIPTFPPASPPEKSEESLFEPHPCVAPYGRTRATVRAGFDEHVFDAAEKSVKYLVLTNTWQKFVKEAEDKIVLEDSV